MFLYSLDTLLHITMSRLSCVFHLSVMFLTCSELTSGLTGQVRIAIPPTITSDEDSEEAHATEGVEEILFDLALTNRTNGFLISSGAFHKSTPISPVS